MTRVKVRQRKVHFKAGLRPIDPNVAPMDQWLESNRWFYSEFRRWLAETSRSEATLGMYSVGARFALGYLKRPYWAIDPDSDLQAVLDYIAAHISAPTHWTEYSKYGYYHKGIRKFGQFIRLRLNKPRVEGDAINWDYYLAGLPDWLGREVRAFCHHRGRNWPVERRRILLQGVAGILTRPLRWLAQEGWLARPEDLTPKGWFAYLDARLATGISPVTLNSELGELRSLMNHLEDEGFPVSPKLFRIRPLPIGARIPKDLPPEQLQTLLAAIREEMESWHAHCRRLAVMDYAWVLLMAHCGLRTGEVRRLRFADIDWGRRKVRIEQSKGLKDRHIYLSEAVSGALRAYLAVRGPGEYLPQEVFTFQHKPLSPSYCGQRLKTYARRCGVRATPHQLRHTCATLLLNAGAPVLTVQAILGHQHIDTTMQYARLYDGTIAADYFRAMRKVEGQLEMAKQQEEGVGLRGTLLDIETQLANVRRDE
jgi:integrase